MVKRVLAKPTRCPAVKLGISEVLSQGPLITFTALCKSMILAVTAFTSPILRFITNKVMIFLTDSKLDYPLKNGRKSRCSKMWVNKYTLKIYLFMSAIRSKLVWIYLWLATTWGEWPVCLWTKLVLALIACSQSHLNWGIMRIIQQGQVKFILLT